jgi:hypothetical protein
MGEVPLIREAGDFRQGQVAAFEEPLGPLDAAGDNAF